MIYINKSGNGIYKVVGRYNNKREAFIALETFKVDLKHHYYLSNANTQKIKTLHIEETKHIKKIIKKEIVQVNQDLEQGFLF